MGATHQTISELRAGQSKRLTKIEHGGSLEARRLSSGAVAFYWRWTEGGKTERTPIGPYDPAAPPKSLKPTGRGYSIAAALDAARELARRNTETPGGLRAERAREEAEAAAEKASRDASVRFTLQALFTEYVAWLKSREKGAWREAELLFANHVKRPFPALAATPAREVEKRQIVEAVRRITEAGKQSTARKLRSYLRAAYVCAMKSDSDATLPAALIAFNVTSNPVEGTAAIPGKAAKNPLSLAELRRYWEALKEEPGPIGAALRLQLLTGAQRVAQLTRLHAGRDLSEDTLQLWDLKGKRAEPRPHLLPITKAIRSELGQLAPSGHVLSTDGGKTAMHPTSLSAWATNVGTRAKIDGFQLKRVRSAVETELARAGIPMQVRAQLQSHGISGVQATHYDAHEYLPEKRKALETLHSLLEGKDAKNVTPIGHKKRA